jgi:hypothetical protein
MFHAVGITPEAPDLGTATGGRAAPEIAITRADIEQGAAELSTIQAGRVDAVSVGTPHYSAVQIRDLAALIAGRSLSIPLYVSTGRDVLEEVGDVEQELIAAGVQIVTDTCTYITPIIDPRVRVVMTDSAKWAYYAPANVGVEVIFGSVRACVEAAATGRATRSW